MKSQCPGAVLPSRALKSDFWEAAASRRLDPFERLVRAHQDRVFRFCARLLASREEAMDLTQETFARAYQHLDGFRQESQASTWLLRIARNLCLNRLKYLSRRGAGRSGPLDELTEAELLGGVELPGRPDEALEQARARARVQRAIDALGEEQRVLVVLRDIEGLSYTEIAQVTELPEGTVRSRLHRAREKLAELLADTSERGT